MKKFDINKIKEFLLDLVAGIKKKLSKLDIKEKNNLILMISGGLIILAVIIAIIGNVASKNKESDTHSTVETVASTNSNVKPETNDTDKTDVYGSNGGSYKVATQNDPLTLRINPDSNSGAVTSIPKGTTIEILGVYDGFGFVIYDGSSGWVNMTYTELISESSKKTTHAPGKYLINSYDGSLSIRNRPDGSLGTAIPNGTEVNIISVCEGIECEWGLMEYNGEVGWLPFTYLK